MPLSLGAQQFVVARPQLWCSNLFLLIVNGIYSVPAVSQAWKIQLKTPVPYSRDRITSTFLRVLRIADEFSAEVWLGGSAVCLIALPFSFAPRLLHTVLLKGALN